MADEVKQEIVPASKVQPQTSTDIEKSAKQTRLAAFTPANLTEAIAMSKMMAQSDMVPKDYRGKAANIMLAMQFGAEVGLAPLQALQSISVINGRPALWGDGALGLVQGHTDFEDILESDTGSEATCTIKRRRRSPVTRKFSMADATKAGLANKEGPWRNYPARMRQMRARGFALRDSFADVLKGISIAEEAMDMPLNENQDVKKQREAGTLDITGTLVESAEPNRGHGDEGMQRGNAIQSSPQTESQESKKQDDWICGDCSGKNLHEETCKHYADWVKKVQDDKTSKPVKEVAVRIDEIDVQKKLDKKTNKRTGPPYRILHITDADNLNWALYVWDTKFHKFIDDAGAGSMMICEYAENKQGEKTFCTLEHILNLKGVKFVNDAPAVSGEMPAESQEREAGGDDPENW